MTAPAKAAKRAHTPAEVAEMLAEPVKTITDHCRTGRLRGAYKAGSGGKTSPWRIPPEAITYYQNTQPRS